MIGILDEALIYLGLSLLLAGPGLYLIDRTFGAAFYRWQYNLRHKDPLTEEQVNGLLIYKRSAHLRFWVAVVLAFCHFAYYTAKGSGFTMQLLMDVVAFFGLFFGFNLGPFAYKLLGKRDSMIQTLDDVSSGKVKLTEKAGAALKGVVDAASHTATSTLRELHAVTASPPQAEEPTVEPAVPQAPPAPEPPRENYRDRIRRYTKRGGTS